MQNIEVYSIDDETYMHEYSIDIICGPGYRGLQKWSVYIRCVQKNVSACF